MAFLYNKPLLADIAYVLAIYATDLDNDGDKDVLSTSLVDNKTAWYENDGNGNFGAQQIINNNVNIASLLTPSI